MNKDHNPRNLSDQESQPTRYRLAIGPALILVALIMLASVIGRVAAKEEKENITTSQKRASTNLPLPTTREDFFFPGTQPGTLVHPIVNPEGCSGCHGNPAGPSIYKGWRGSMMGQAGRDPVFWAAFAVAQNDAVDAGEFCLRCHTPKGWYEGRSDPADGSALTEVDISAGLACEVCHRMVDPVAGADDEAAERDEIVRAALTNPPPTDHFGSAMLILDPEDNRRGPFSLPNFGPHTAFQAKFQGQNDPLTASRLCGSCHNVDNPLLSWNENPPNGGEPQYWPNETNTPAESFGKDDLFPVERTYEEWLNSDYANGGVFAPQFAGAKLDGMVSSCQDCHMVRQVGKASIISPVIRNCNTNGCLPAHVFAGGNSWVPQILQDQRWRLRAPDNETGALNQTTLEAQSMLARAASLNLNLEDDVLTVRVTNETGHKLPTGYPEGRRLWLNVRAYDSNEALIYESGAYNESTGLLTKDADIKVYEVEQGLTPELADLVGMEAGPTFHFALNNTTIKDNRIPPRGYTVAAFDRPGLRPVGVTYADGQYWDDTQYNLPPETERVVVTLYYQLSSSDYIDFLREQGGADGETLGQMWDDNKSPPELVARAEFPAPNLNFIPWTGGR
ncbi:MAG: hypothetical protein KBF17_01805 [Candidatus Promineofilum sp.]|nr:hypothetical protein [Promineifilum sp.]MBP9657364.1 hypothetical protein [Promineifilum sp.]